MSCGSAYIPELRSRGYRVTSQRMAVLHVLRHARTRLSPAQVYQRARRDLPGLTEATVYRTLDFLARTGLAWPIRVRDKQGGAHTVYELAGERHHHLICRECGSEIELKHSALQEVYAQIEHLSGYRLTDEHLTFFGLCPDCQKNFTPTGG